MSKFFFWIILSSITGSPILSAVLLLLGYWVLDRFTWGLLPDPLRLLRRWLRMGRLRRDLQNNPHDRRARLELAEALVGRRRYQEAMEVLRPNIEAGDDDAGTLFTFGLACLGVGHHSQGEVFLEQAAQTDPAFRMGEVELERGRWRLARGEFAKAREALETFCAVRVGTVEGRVLLSRALLGAGDDGAAALKRDEAWREYVQAPRFRRRTERFWAWRARPSRPITYAAAILLAVGFFGFFVAPRLSEAVRQSGEGQGDYSGEYVEP